MDYQSQPLNVRKQGFSLVEMLCAMGIVAMLMAITAVKLVPVMQAYQLSSAASQLQGNLGYGSQLASKLNRPVSLRFYRYTGNDPAARTGYGQYQFLCRDPVDGSSRALTHVYRIEPGVALHPGQEFSSLFALEQKHAADSDPEIAFGPHKSRTYAYVELQFRPDGSTSLSQDRNWFITLVSQDHAETPSLPRNFRTLVIRSANGSVSVY